MAKYLLKRVLQAIGVVFCISLITFFVLNIVPGNPVEQLSLLVLLIYWLLF